jgi:hypothetical protein
LTLETTLRDSHRPVSRLVTLTAGGIVRSTYAPVRIILDGTVEVDRTREIRRSLRLRLVDEDGTLAPGLADDEFAPGQRLRVDRGAVIDGTEVYVTLGTFVIGSFEVDLAGSLTLSGDDPAVSLQQDFGEIVTVGAGLAASDALRLLWEPVLGDGSGWDLDAEAGRLGASRTFGEDEERLTATLDLMADNGLEAYMDRTGTPVLRLVPDPLAAVPARTYEQSAGVALATAITRRGDWMPVNRQVVIGDQPSGELVRGEALITDLSHPWHPDRIGLRSAPVHRSAAVGTQYQANSLAAILLRERTLWRDAVEWSGIPDPTLDVDDVVRFIDAQTGTDALYRVDRISLPVAMGTMSVSASRVLPLYAEEG